MWDLLHRMEHWLLAVGVALVGGFYVVATHVPALTHLHAGATASVLVTSAALRIRRLSRRTKCLIFSVAVVVASALSILAIYIPESRVHFHTAATIAALFTNLALIWE